MFGKPTAIALAHPWPPLPTNLTKRQVLRFPGTNNKENHRDGEQGKANGDNGTMEDIKKAKEFVDHEKRPFNLPPDSTEKEMISEIELAIYWDRHAYEFKPKRTTSADNIRRFKSMSSLVDKKLNTVDVGVQKDWFEEVAVDERENEKRLRLLQVERRNVSCQTAELRDAPCQCYCWKHLPHPKLVQMQMQRSKSAAPKLVKCAATNTNGDGEVQIQTRNCYNGKFILPNASASILKNGNLKFNQQQKNLQKRNPALKFSSKPKKSTEYGANFRNPFKIGEAESRILKSKVLNRCFECSRK
jgi:hypothetical protein